MKVPVGLIVKNIVTKGDGPDDENRELGLDFFRLGREISTWVNAFLYAFSLNKNSFFVPAFYRINFIIIV